MTRVLCVDTSTWWGGVALVEQREPEGAIEIVAELGVEVEDSHADHLLGWVERLLSAAGWSKAGLDAYVAIRGPGSFTGIRVGLGTIQGLGLATTRPCLGVNTLEALAEAHGPAAGPRVPVLDAGRGEFYSARYDARSSPPEPLVEPALISATLEDLPEGGAGLVVIPGPGTRVDDSIARGGYFLARAPRGIAAAAGRLALLRGLDATQVTTLAPLYVRSADAWVKLGRR